MKKKITLIAIMFSFIKMGFTQASLPTSYDFNNFVSLANLPSGWSSNISGTFTYAVGQVGTAGRFDLQGEYVEVFTQNAMGTTTFYLKGFAGTGARGERLRIVLEGAPYRGGPSPWERTPARGTAPAPLPTGTAPLDPRFGLAHRTQRVGRAIASHLAARSSRTRAGQR